jgi:hypothetical protein
MTSVKSRLPLIAAVTRSQVNVNGWDAENDDIAVVTQEHCNSDALGAMLRVPQILTALLPEIPPL